MSINNFVVQVAPMDHVAKVVQQEQESALMKQQVLQQLLPDKLMKDGQQVEKTAAGESGQKVARRKKERGRQGHDGRPARDEDPAAALGLEEQLTELGIDSETGSNVWAGNIVNVKV